LCDDTTGRPELSNLSAALSGSAGWTRARARSVGGELQAPCSRTRPLSLDEGECPSHRPGRDHQHDRRREQQTHQTEQEHTLAHAEGYSSLPRPGWVNQFTCNEGRRSRARRLGCRRKVTSGCAASCRRSTRRHKGDASTELSEGAGRCATRAALRSQHHDNRAHPHPTVEVDHILIGQPNAARRNRMSDPSGLVRTVDAIERVLAA